MSREYPPWKCTLCTELVDTEDIISGQHMQLFHPDYDTAPERWPDGTVITWDDPAEEEIYLWDVH